MTAVSPGLARRFTLDDAPFAARSGRGVLVAVVDSGIHAPHPHLHGILVRGLAVHAESESDDFGDRLGHGTAVAAAIAEKAPGAALLALRVFDRALATSAARLARAIVVAADRGARLINLSLGTPNAAHARLLGEAVVHAAARGAIVVSARAVEGAPWLPGALPGVAGVVVDAEGDRSSLSLRIDADGTSSFAASGHPRPIPGVPPERNLSGISFAVANATGFLARLLEGDDAPRDVAEVVRRLT